MVDMKWLCIKHILLVYLKYQIRYIKWLCGVLNDDTVKNVMQL